MNPKDYNSIRSGCRSPRTGSSRRHPACSSRRGTCTSSREDGRKILDGTAGLWCSNAGHCRPKIVAAIREQAGELDYAPHVPDGSSRAVQGRGAAEGAACPPISTIAFFTNSGSEAVDTALKIALAYHRARGEGSRRWLIGRERGYHGANFGGMSVGGIPGNRKAFGNLLPDRRPSAAHAQSRAELVLPRPAGVGRASRGRARNAHRRAARRVQHRRGDRRADGRLGGRAGPAAGLSRASARDLRQARHPAHLRRGHHRLRPTRRAVRDETFRRGARHHLPRQGPHQRRGADGRGRGAQRHLRNA